MTDGKLKLDNSGVGGARLGSVGNPNDPYLVIGFDDDNDNGIVN